MEQGGVCEMKLQNLLFSGSTWIIYDKSGVFSPPLYEFNLIYFFFRFGKGGTFVGF